MKKNMKRIAILFAATATLCLAACSHKAEEGGDASSEEAAAPGDIPDGDATASADAAAAIAAAMAASPTATDMPSAAPSATPSASGAPPATGPSPAETAHTETH